jgi:F0F1-type ATP synthase epsilon subunit
MATTTSQKLIRCVIVTPEQTVLNAKAAGVSLPLDDGSRGIAAGHAPFIGRLGAGEVQLHGVAGGTGAETTICTFVEGGFVEVGNNEVTVITQGALDSGSIKGPEIQAELENLYQQKAVGDDQIDALLKAESTARARLRAARRKRK